MILKKLSGVCAAAVALILLCALCAGALTAEADGPTQTPACDPRFTALFTPRHPRLGRYETCADSRPLAQIAPADWPVQALDPADAFGAAGTADRSTLVRLYAGARPGVARGWTETPDRFESQTWISPYPNAALTRLEAGTLVIRWICDYENARCTMPNAK